MEFHRKKSCKQCRLSKTRCNLAKPCCQRCERKNLTCKYEHQAPNQTSTESSNGDGILFHSWVAGTKSTNPAPRAGVSQPEGSAGFNQDVRIEELLDFDMPLDVNLDEMYTADMQWSSERAIPAPTSVPEREARGTLLGKEIRDDVCWYEFPSNGGSASNRSPLSRQPVPITAEDGHHFNEFVLSMMKTLPSSPFDVPGWQELGNESNKLPHLFTRKKVTTAGSLLTRNLMWSTIKSEAFAFEYGTLPFFIHRKSSPQVCTSGDAAEALANCGSIMSMYRQKTEACKQLVLKTLLLEIQRLYEQCGTCDDLTLIHNIQALSMYTIIIAADEKRCRLLSVIMRLTGGEIAERVNRGGLRCKSEVRGNFPSWNDWIRAESKRRTLIVMHLLDVLLNFDIGTPRPADCSAMDQMYLPCSKTLWEAETEVAWEKEYKQYLSTRDGEGLLTIGDLRRANDLSVDEVDKDIMNDLSRWAEEADSLGSLLLSGVLSR